MNLRKKFFFISKNIFFKKNKFKVNRKAGVNFTGRKTVRSRGFINNKKKRIIDFFGNFINIKGFILNFEYDPNRNTLISLILYLNGVFSYSISLEKFGVGKSIFNSNSNLILNYGSFVNLIYIPKKIKICNLEINLFKGSKLLRASGSFGKIISKNKKNCKIKLKNKKIKKINIRCKAVIGSILNFNFFINKRKNAGDSRVKGFKSKVRGVAMNPIDHPHGGGEGKKSKKTSPMSIWGKRNVKKKCKKKKSF